MKGKKVDIFWDNINHTGCKWSSLNAPITETPVYHPLSEESNFPFSAPSSLSLSGVIRNWKQVDIFWDKSVTQAANGPV